jgi:Acyl-CoA thioester hydrolase/BAAT N-terminal region
MKGRVILGRTRALGGSYSGRDPTAPFWAMTPVSGREDVFVVPEGPWPVTLELRADRKRLARGTVTRSVSLPGTSSLELRVASAGLRGAYFARPSEARAPAVLLLGGSEGGLGGRRLASLLAARGFPTLALAYFRDEGCRHSLRTFRSSTFSVPLDGSRRSLRSIRGGCLCLASLAEPRQRS